MTRWRLPRLFGKGAPLINSRFVVAALWVIGSLPCVAHGGNINGEATYVSFLVPGSFGTYPMGINASMEVTGIYYTSSTQGAFLREADGTITTFAVNGATSTVPEGINAGGDITGYYFMPMEYSALGFLRYADGRMITFENDETNGKFGFLPVAINDLDEIVGNEVYEGINALTRSRAGVISSLVLGPPGGPAPVATALNASGSIVGYFEDQGASIFNGFVLHPDGYVVAIDPPGNPDPVCSNQIFPDTINAAGTIAGFFTENYSFSPSCGAAITGGFVLSPEGSLTLFQAPGPIPMFEDHDQDMFLMDPHWININQAGDIAGSYISGEGTYHVFVRNPYGTITSFDPPEGGQTHVTGINDGGAIAGYYSYNYKGGLGQTAGFIRIPQ
jgi:hypothetical protein